jgi:tRNA pseudouridine(54/55) synthase
LDIDPKDIEYIDITMIRKIFKPILLSKIHGLIEKPYNHKGSLEFKVTFEFSEAFYKNVYESFSTNSAIKKIGEKRFKPNSINIDKSDLNQLIKNTSSDYLVALVNKLYNSNENMLDVQVELVYNNIFIKGNYLKYSREIGQTPWTVNGVKICDSSVEEEISRKIKELFKADNSIMSAGGREDRDVRMLGHGRPFVMEIYNPKRKDKALADLSAVQKSINESTVLVEVINLTECDKNEFAVLKKYEDSKHKLYTCLVWCSKVIDDNDIEKINAVKDMEVIQKTPIRVMHRRTMMDRKKVIYKLEGKKINDNFIVKMFLIL